MPKLTVNLKSFICYKDTSESNSDEPYVLVFAADLRNIVPTAHTILYGRWGDIDSGDRGRTGSLFYGPGGKPLVPPENFWGIDGKPTDLNDADKVIFLVGLMENDNGNPSSIRTVVHSQLFAALASYSGLSRQDKVNKLRATMRDALGTPFLTGFPNKDDIVGVAELVIDVRRRRANTEISSLHINGDGGRYELFFEVNTY